MLNLSQDKQNEGRFSKHVLKDRDLFFVILGGFGTFKFSRKDRHFQELTREIRNIGKINVSENFSCKS